MKKIAYLFILTALICCKSPVEVDLYGDITGTVIDGVSKEPISGALVTLSPSSSSARTGTDGKYSFTNLDPKDYKLDVSSEGYANDTKTLTIKAGETTIGDFSLGSIQPTLTVSTLNMDFGTDQTLIPLEITNTGKGTLTWSLVENVPWLTVNPASGSTTTQKSSVVITIDRTGLAEGSYSQSISVVSNGGVQIVTVSMTVTNPNSPKLVTGNAINISQTTADIIGTISSMGLGSILKHGHCYSTLPNPTINDKKTDLGPTSSVGQFTSSLTELLGNTTYYIRAYAINSLGTGYSTQVSFTTSASPTLPNVTTEAAKNITETTASIGGEVATVGSTSITQHGHCWATTQNPTINETKTTLGAKTNIGAFTSNLASLIAGTTYYVRAYATNAAGTSYSPQISFTSAAAPTLAVVTTNPNSNLKYNAVTFNGTMTNLGGVSVSEYGFCYATTQTPTLINNKLVSGTNANAIGSFTANAANLTPGTTYYVRAFAINSVGTAYGAQVTFTTPAIINPSLTFGIPSNITYNSASVSGSITVTGDLPITTYGFCLSSTQTTPTTADVNIVCSNLSNSNFSIVLTNLNQNTKYYIRSYAISSSGTYYSPVASFNTTSIAIPVLTFDGATNITYKSASVGGSISVTGDLPITEYGFCYSNTATTPTISNTKEVCANLNGTDFSANLDLAQKTKYYIRSYATTSGGTYYSPVANFTTTADPYTVSDGLLAFYNFDTQNCNDAMGSYNGVISGGVTFASSTPNSTGYAAQFDGINGYINIPYQILPSSGSWSISMWVKTNKNKITLFSIYQYCMTITTNAQLHMYFSLYRSFDSQISLTNSLLNNSWHHVIVAFNGSKINFYIDSNLVDTKTELYNWGNHTSEQIGQYSLNDGYYSGSMDNIRLYNKALSTTEISTLYNAKQ